MLNLLSKDVGKVMIEGEKRANVTLLEEDHKIRRVIRIVHDECWTKESNLCLWCFSFTDSFIFVFTHEQTAGEAPPLELSAAWGNQLVSSWAVVGLLYTPTDIDQVSQTDWWAILWVTVLASCSPGVRSWSELPVRCQSPALGRPTRLSPTHRCWSQRSPLKTQTKKKSYLVTNF